MSASRALVRAPLLVALLAVPRLAAAAQEGEDEEPRVVPANGLSIRVEGQLQVQFNSTSVDAEPTWDGELRRARMTLIGQATPDVSAQLQADFGQDRARIRDAFAELQVSDGVALRAGQFKIPFNGIEMVSSKRLLVIERGVDVRGLDVQSTSSFLSDERLAARSRGVMAIAELPRRVTVWAGGWLGSGEGSEDDEGKQLAARVEVEALPEREDGGGPLVLGLAAVTNGYYGEPDDTLQVVEGDSVVVEDPEYATALEGWVSWGTYLEPGLHAAGNVVAGGNPGGLRIEGDELELATFLGLQGWAELLLPLEGPLTGVAPAFRLDRFDPDTDSDDDASLLVTPGVNIYAGKNLKLQANLDLFFPDAEDAEEESAFRIQGQVLF